MPPTRLYDVASLAELVYESENGTVPAQIAVIIPLYNYAVTVLEALDSVVRQGLSPLSIVVVDDASSDGGGERATTFLERHRARFVTARVLRHYRNQGLSMARNSGIAWSSEPYLFMLDADNRLRPPALSRLMEALHASDAAFAYSQLRLFGEEDGFGIADVWSPAQLALDNYIDAMALIRRERLIEVGGYAVLAEDVSWEDYDLWCRFAELGYEGVFVPELLCEYRVHDASRNRAVLPHYYAMMTEMALRHPRLFSRRDAIRAG